MLSSCGDVGLYAAWLTQANLKCFYFLVIIVVIICVCVFGIVAAEWSVGSACEECKGKTMLMSFLVILSRANF